jgi:hypothetical protein
MTSSGLGYSINHNSDGDFSDNDNIEYLDVNMLKSKQTLRKTTSKQTLLRKTTLSRIREIK